VHVQRVVDRDITQYINSQPAGNNPIPLVIDANYSGDWEELLNQIKAACETNGKKVALNISDTTLATNASGVFDPRNPDSNATDATRRTPYNTGEKYIEELVLPTAATSIAVGLSSSNAAFYGFKNSLTKITGNGITGTIGASAFYGCTSLTTASFPNATSIGDTAFYDCTSLTTVNFPKATSIGSSAFAGCTSLATVNIPKATTIGSSAFAGCTSLTTVDFPEATKIGNYAFMNCTSLTTVDFPKVTSIGLVAFDVIDTSTTSISTIKLGASCNISSEIYIEYTPITQPLAAHYNGVSGNKAGTYTYNKISKSWSGPTR
jgi:hypothetical protein